MKFPTIHLNGDKKTTLLNQNVAAMQAIREALDTLGEAAPNARNFYTQGNDAYSAAREEHSARVRKLQDVLTELETIAEHIADTE